MERKQKRYKEKGVEIARGYRKTIPIGYRNREKKTGRMKIKKEKDQVNMTITIWESKIK